MCRIRSCDLPNDQKIVQHPHRSEFLLNGRFGPRKVLNPGSHMERSHGREFQAMSGAPVKKLPARPSVSSPSVPVADRGGEEVNVGFSDFRAGSEGLQQKPEAISLAKELNDMSGLGFALWHAGCLAHLKSDPGEVERFLSD